MESIVLAAVPAASPGGRGLGLVRMMASQLGLGEEAGIWNGKIVWFELDLEDLGMPVPGQQ